MIKTLKVILWDKEIGRLSWDDLRRISYFTYNPDFIKGNLDLTPLSHPMDKRRAFLPIWGEEEKIYQKLPAFIADSLPDSWGNQLFDLWRQNNHLSSSDVNPLDKLSFIGKRAMGALEFVPEVTRERIPKTLDIQSLASLADRIFTEREHARILPDESVTLQSLLMVGTSAGGRQPKAVVAINPKSGEIRSGQIAGLEGFDYFLLKFGRPEFCSAELEMTYYELATRAGINMMPCSIYSIDGNHHFLTRRFDRENGRKIHVQTLAAICPGANSYEELTDVCRQLNLPESDLQEIFRRMVFNILANNTDDHNKNFSFLMNEKGAWRLSPAYDITYIINVGGVQPEEDHCLFLRAKLCDFTIEDVLQFAADNGVRNPLAIIEKTADSLKGFRETATRNGVTEIWIGRVEHTLQKHLSAWNLSDASQEKYTFEMNGLLYSNVCLEQTYKGNFHLYATVNERSYKFVIGKSKAAYKWISDMGLSNVTETELKSLVSEFIKPRID